MGKQKASDSDDENADVETEEASVEEEELEEESSEAEPNEEEEEESGEEDRNEEESGEEVPDEEESGEEDPNEEEECGEEDPDGEEETCEDDPSEEEDSEEELNEEEASEETDKDPSKEDRSPVAQSSSGSEDAEEHQSNSALSHSDKKRAADRSEGSVQKKHKQDLNLKLESYAGSSGTDIQDMTKNLNRDDSKSIGSSSKKRRSRWDIEPGADEQAADGGNVDTKKRKTRWASDDTQLKMLGPLKLPDFMKGLVPEADLDPEIWELKWQLRETNKKLLAQEICDDRPENERSPSPTPIYNDLGIRINTREVRTRSKLIGRRKMIIAELIKRNPTFKPPPDYEPPKFYKKLYIPVKEYPGYNFIGLIIGPRGLTQKRMEKESGARISLRGKGSVKEEKAPQINDEDLHVYIEADTQYSLDAAVGMVEKLLVPVEEEKNEHKWAQLRELAMLDGTYREENKQRVRKLPAKTNVTCEVCGYASHPTTACPLTASTPGNSGQLVDSVTKLGSGLFFPFSGPPAPTSTISRTANPASGFLSAKGSEPPRFYKRLYIPVKEYPGYNFLGLIIGPRGRTQKRMEKETGARISLRGKGFVRGEKPLQINDEDLHVYIEANTQNSLDAAVAMVEKLLVPVEEEKNEHKHGQLKELAMLHGTCREERTHSLQKMMAKTIVTCEVCGDASHLTTACPLTASTPGSSTRGQQVDSLTKLGNGLFFPFSGPPAPTSTVSWTANPASGVLSSNSDMPVKEIDEAKLYVGHLPQSVNDNKLIELFLPFGQICEAKVIKDRSTGLSKGYGFVKYVDAIFAAEAVARMNGHRIEEKILAVRVAGWPPSTASIKTGLVPPQSFTHLPTYLGPAAIAQGNPGLVPATITHGNPGLVPAAISQGNPGPMNWPGPQASMLPDPYASFPKSTGFLVQTDPVGGQSPASFGSSTQSLASFPLISGGITSFRELAQFPGYLNSLDSRDLMYQVKPPNPLLSTEAHATLSFSSHQTPIIRRTPPL